MARNAPVAGAARGVDAVLICTPDAAIASVAAAIAPEQDGAAVLHCSGATGLDALAPHARPGSLHPLMALPDASTGSVRLAGGGWFAVAGDAIANELVKVLGGRAFEVADEDRALYHGTAVVAANHVVALLAQVERLAAVAGVPVEAFFEMAQGSLDDVIARGARSALTGPASRGDHATLDSHRQALAAVSEADVGLYNVLAEACAALAELPAESERSES